MPRKAKQQPTESVESVAVAEVKTAEPKSEKKSKRAKAKTKEEAPAETVPETTTVAEATESAPTKKKRVTPDRDSVLKGFDELVASVDEEIKKLRETTKSKGVKFLRSLNKKLKSVRTQSSRVMKQRNKTVRKNNNNSGFLKPVRISKEMAKFTGWDQKELRSRTAVTKQICTYIKEQGLQNPADRRQIQVEKDPKLQKLLGYDPKTDKVPVTYYRLQSLMKSHFSKPEEATA